MSVVLGTETVTERSPSQQNPHMNPILSLNPIRYKPAVVHQEAYRGTTSHHRMAIAIHLPQGVKSLSELIEIERTTQTTLYVAPRDLVDLISMTLNL